MTRGRVIRVARELAILMVVTTVMSSGFGCGGVAVVAVVASARPGMSAREIVAPIEQQAASSSSSDVADVAQQDGVDDWSSSDFVGEFSNGGGRGRGGRGGRGGGGVVGDPVVWDDDVEAESPPAQRQRDRSLWGMSKRLVPTGPNPLHN